MSRGNLGWGKRGSHGGRGLGIHLCPRHPHFSFGSSNSNPKKGGPVSEVWTLWGPLLRPPQGKGTLDQAAGSGKEGLDTADTPPFNSEDCEEGGTRESRAR